MRIIVRGYGDGALIFQEQVDGDLLDSHKAEEHINLVTRFEKHLIEIEYLDEPDPLQRFYRFGTDMSRMVAPTEIPR